MSASTGCGHDLLAKVYVAGGLIVGAAPPVPIRPRQEPPRRSKTLAALDPVQRATARPRRRGRAAAAMPPGAWVGSRRDAARFRHPPWTAIRRWPAGQAATDQPVLHGAARSGQCRPAGPSRWDRGPAVTRSRRQVPGSPAPRSLLVPGNGPPVPPAQPWDRGPPPRSFTWVERPGGNAPGGPGCVHGPEGHRGRGRAGDPLLGLRCEPWRASRCCRGSSWPSPSRSSPPRSRGSPRAEDVSAGRQNAAAPSARTENWDIVCGKFQHRAY
jgi:hypothetical protein